MPFNEHSTFLPSPFFYKASLNFPAKIVNKIYNITYRSKNKVVELQTFDVTKML